MNDKAFIITYSASFIVTLTLILLSKDNYWYLLIYAGFLPSLIDHIKQFKQERLAKGQTRLRL